MQQELIVLVQFPKAVAQEPRHGGGLDEERRGLGSRHVLRRAHLQDCTGGHTDGAASSGVVHPQQLQGGRQASRLPP